MLVVIVDCISLVVLEQSQAFGCIVQVYQWHTLSRLRLQCVPIQPVAHWSLKVRSNNCCSHSSSSESLRLREYLLRLVCGCTGLIGVLQTGRVTGVLSGRLVRFIVCRHCALLRVYCSVWAIQFNCALSGCRCRLLHHWCLLHLLFRLLRCGLAIKCCNFSSKDFRKSCHLLFPLLFAMCVL